MSAHQVIIIGAGIAGASTAWALRQAGVNDILILEQGAQAGMHSTSRNAAILRTSIKQPALQRMARESAEFYRSAPTSFAEQPLIDAVGLFVTADKHSNAQNGMSSAANSSVAEIRAHYPDFLDADVDVWHFSDEGTLDIHGLLQAFLKGQTVRTHCKVDEIIYNNDSACGVRCGDEIINAQQIVVANGGWANHLCSDTGLNQPFSPRRRHLMVSSPIEHIDQQLPVVWCTGDNEFYFRPESGGLLISACDHELVDPRYGENIDPNIIENIAAKTGHWLPGLSDTQPQHLWSGLRTFSPDHNFIVGPDPHKGNLFWATGLAGHGMTTAYSVGQILGAWMCDKKCTHPSANDLLPQRLVDVPRFAGI